MTCGVSCGAQLAFAGKGTVAITADDDHDGTFTVVASHADAAQYYHNVQWVDADGDATPELLVATTNFSDAGDEQLVDRYDGVAITTAFDLRTIDDGSGGTPWRRYLPITISSGDYDGDGALDLAWIGTFPSFQVARGRGMLRFESGPQGSAGPPDLSNPIADGVGWGDVDGDGDDDLAIVTDTQLYILTSDHHALTPTAPIAMPGRTYWGAWADADGDGKLDLALAGNAFARVYKNSGAALDPTPIFELDGPQFYGGAWTDLDGDGKLDLALTVNDGKLGVYLNQGATFATTPVWTSIEDQTAPVIVSADVDGDHDLDLIVANHAPRPSRIYVNLGDESYDLATVQLPAQDYESVSPTARTAPTR
ncbi:MAG TPA: VCBS repeat-containing protein [Kofleriaceae bacterium]|nr:VCBS repeat-containing protein [Kofleriaceae bacterium]